jgi:predicted O-methyltransferase YrrM
MKERLRTLLAQLEQWGREYDAQETDHSRRMLNLEPDTARLVYILMRGNGARRVLEIGTSNGYSTIWLASAAAVNGGRVTSIDVSAEKQAMARENLQRAGLAGFVNFVRGPAETMVKDLTGPFDVVLFDADRKGAAANLEVLLPKLEPSALLLADNVLSHPDEIAAYLEALKKLEGFEHVVVPIGKGLSVAYRGACDQPGVSWTVRDVE